MHVLISDAWKSHSDIRGWSMQCGTAAYEDVLESIRPSMRCDPHDWRPDTIVTRWGHVFLSEDPDLPLHHIVLQDKDGQVHAGLVLVRG
jgi:hypothetical protein